MKSHHGAPQTLLEIKVNSKKEAKQSLRSLGDPVLNQIMENGHLQIDEDKVFHIRLSLSSFVAGNIRLAEGEDRKSSKRTLQNRVILIAGPARSSVRIDKEIRLIVRLIFPPTYPEIGQGFSMHPLDAITSDRMTM